MRFIKKVMVFVMGLVVIGVVSTTVGVVTQAKTVEKSVTFEILENDVLSYNVYDKINGYANYNELNFYNADNVVSLSINDNAVVAPTVIYQVNTTNIQILDYEGEIIDVTITNENTYIINMGTNVGDTISITFDVEVETPVIIKTLLVLIPLILSAGLIGYIVVKKGDE